MFKSPETLNESPEPRLSQKELLKEFYYRIGIGLNLEDIILLADKETLEKIRLNQPPIKTVIKYKLLKGYDVTDYVLLATEATLKSIKEDVDLRHIKVAEIFNDALQKEQLTSIKKREGLEHIIN